MSTLRAKLYNREMYPGEFETLFNNVSNLFTLDTVAQKKKLKGEYPKRGPHTPLWDTMDSTLGYDYIDIGGGRYVSCQNFLKKPVRILFFMLLTEFEGRLFRIHEWQGRDLSELNEKNLNDLISDLVNSELIKLQTEYESRGKFNEDLKACSAFRNVIMHVNKKLERSVELKTLIERKKQASRLLLALQEILDRMPRSAPTVHN